MKKDILHIHSEENKGFTLIEVLVSIVILTIIIFSSMFIFKESVRKFRKNTYEKEIYKTATETFQTIEKYLKNAKINNLNGKLRMNFKGEKQWIKFITTTEESKESDFLKVGIYFQDNNLKMNIEKIDKESDFSFKEGFPGAQILAENIRNFEILYFDGTNYVSNWDTENTEEPQLPPFVKIIMEIESGMKVEGKKLNKNFERIIKVGYE
ncbi:MAG TPA: prepilin-type N-terminal cleavage/methylation domain-containing protein [Candidatus Ratteibacteria bacterium]|nr:prepilin-type N-terminal cleavage/methylation domain-containing protein [Candidatus Ratteibacteria bacterium]